MGSISHANAESYKAYAEKFSQELFGQFFFGFKTGKEVTPHEGVKGRKILTELILEDLVRRWRKTFDPIDDAMSFKPRQIETELCKVDLEIFPQEFEGSYLGEMRRKGQNQKDLPFERYILNRILNKIANEMEKAYWQAEATDNPQPGDKLIEMFDGILTHVDKAIAADEITPFPTPGLSRENIVGYAEDMYDQLSEEMKEAPLTLRLSPKNWQRYFQNYRHEFGKYTNPHGQKVLKLDVGDVTLISTPGMGNTDRMILTADSNYHYAYDGAADHSMINMEWEKRGLGLWIDFRMGAQVGILDDRGLIIVNDPSEESASA